VVVPEAEGAAVARALRKAFRAPETPGVRVPEIAPWDDVNAACAKSELSPEVTGDVARVWQWLQQNEPSNVSQEIAGSRPMPVATFERFAFEQQAAVALDPMAAVAYAASGILSKQQAAVLAQVWPKTYASIVAAMALVLPHLKLSVQQSASAARLAGVSTYSDLVAAAKGAQPSAGKKGAPAAEAKRSGDVSLAPKSQALDSASHGG
jgi:hypothetical protein